jgi:hypothetical protein
MSKYLDLGGLEHLSDYLQTDDVTLERASDGSLKLSTSQTVWFGHRADWEALSPTEKAKYGIVIFDDDGTTITVDSALSTTSENPVQNKVITTELNKKVNSSSLANVATSGSYNDLSDKPTIPTVGDGTITIQKNGTAVDTFTTNQSSNKSINISVPTKTSDITNDSGYITDAGVTGVKGSSETSYRTGNVNITKANIGLSNVPNVTTNNQTPTFTQASSRANIASGETLTVIMGKIMKFFADLKTVAFTGSYTDLSNKPTIPTVDSTLSTTSVNPVQNKAITVEINKKQPKTLATPLTLGGQQYTTVESFLGAVKDIVQATSYWNGGA